MVNCPLLAGTTSCTPGTVGQTQTIGNPGGTPFTSLQCPGTTFVVAARVCADSNTVLDSIQLTCSDGTILNQSPNGCSSQSYSVNVDGYSQAAGGILAYAYSSNGAVAEIVLSGNDCETASLGRSNGLQSYNIPSNGFISGFGGTIGYLEGTNTFGHFDNLFFYYTCQ